MSDNKTNTGNLLLALIFFGAVTSFLFRSKRKKTGYQIPYDDFDGSYYNMTDDEQLEMLKGYKIPDVEEGADMPNMSYGEVQPPKPTVESTVGDIITLTINNNTDGNMPLVSLVGNDQDRMDTANATTRYFWNITTFFFTTENTVIIQYKAVGDTSFSTASAPILGDTFTALINALNTLNLGQFFITTSGGQTILNNYNDNVVFGTLNVTLTNGTIINTAFNQGFGYDKDGYSVAVFSGGIVVIFINNGGVYKDSFTPPNGIFSVLTNGNVNSNFGFNNAPLIYNINNVNKSAVTPNNKIVYVGNNIAGGIANGDYISVINSDGTFYTGFSCLGTFSGELLDVVVQTDGKYVVGGQPNAFARLNQDGSIDVTFNTGTGFDGTVQKLALQSDGKIIVSGTFGVYNGNTITLGICRINTDGSFDNTFTPNVACGGSYFLQAQSDDKILVGNTPIIRLSSNGTQDLTYVSSQTGYCCALQTDGKLIVGTGSSPNVVRINTDGSTDSSWVVPSGYISGIPTSLFIYGNTLYVTAQVGSLPSSIYCFNLEY